MQISTQIENITPDFAIDVLTTKNINNRSIKPANLNRLITAIDNGQWVVTHQGIAFDDNGYLLDGQHRLEAIVKTGKTLPMMVTRNISAKIFNCIDTGTARSAADSLFIEGCTQPSRVAAGIKVYILYQRYPKGNWSNVINPTHLEIFDNYIKNKEIWDFIVKEINVCHKKFHFFTLSVAIAMYKLIKDNNYDEKICEKFWKQISEGANLEIDNPILSFRHQMMSKGFRQRGSSSQRYLLNAFIRLFNFWIDDIKKTRFVAPPSDITYMLKIYPKLSE
tara:strand:- start:26 stop:859 length:834 start_codon:yes stop_codon:yes gene_type:complete